MNLILGNKLALVTGSSRGIGAAIASRLAADGATVLVHDAASRDRADAANGPMSDAQKKMTSVGRYGRPEEIADAVAFLASPGAAFINGESLTVDGGFNA